jgi:hypothetical protein
MQYRAVCLGLVTTLLSACFHVELGARPAPRAPIGDRIAAYQRLRPRTVDREITVTTSKHGTSVTVESTLTLADGTTVTHADDLLPVLDPSSPAARAARASASARANKWMFEIGGGVVALGGLLYALGEPGGDPYEEISDTQMRIGLGAVVVGSIGILIGQFYFRRQEEQLRRSAFFTFDESLRGSLQLCVNGMNLVDCQAPTHVGPPGALQP